MTVEDIAALYVRAARHAGTVPACEACSANLLLAARHLEAVNAQGFNGWTNTRNRAVWLIIQEIGKRAQSEGMRR